MVRNNLYLKDKFNVVWMNNFDININTVHEVDMSLLCGKISTNHKLIP